MHGMHCLPLQFLNIFVHSVSSASLWAVFTPQIIDEDHVLYLQPPTSCQTWIKNGDKLGLHCLNERNTASDLFLVQTWTTFKMLVLVSFHTLNKNKIPSVGRWKDFFFMQPFLRYKAFMWTVYFLKPNFIFSSFSWWVWFIHCVLWTCQSTVSYPFSLAAVMATQRRPGAVVHDLKFCTKKWTVVTHSWCIFKSSDILASFVYV